MRLGPLVCGLLRPPLHAGARDDFQPGSARYKWLFLFGIHEPGLTKIFANPGQQFSTRAGSGNIPSNKLERIFGPNISLYDCRL